MFLSSLAFVLNAYLIIRGFRKETEKKAAEGFPISSLEGFGSVSQFNRSVFVNSAIITIAITLSFLLYLLSAYIIPFITERFTDIAIIAALGELITPVIFFSSLGLVFIAIGVWLLLKIPEKPAFLPGAMLKYYIPRSTPIVLDNFLSDAIIAFLDPITAIRMDEWTESIRVRLNPQFEPYLPEQTRLEQAKEKIFLMFYLKERMSGIFTSDTFLKELKEVIREEEVSSFLEGESSGISATILEETINTLLTQMPEIFETIDRIVIELVDNLPEFNSNRDIWINVSSPEKVVGNREPFRLLIFALNRDVNKTNRKMTFRAEGPVKTYMEKQELKIILDDAEAFNLPEKLPFTSEEETDVLSVLSKILQIGDAVWFTFSRKSFDTHLFHLSVEEQDASIFTLTTQTDVVRDLMYYVTEYGGRLSALGGLATPAIGFLLPILLRLFE
jgi:hypothetical protein